MPPDPAQIATPVLPASANPELADSLFREIVGTIQALRPRDDLSILEEAYRYAAKYHAG